VVLSGVAHREEEYPISRPGEFKRSVKRAAIHRQGGVCAFCGVSLETPWSSGDFQGYAHHLLPLKHGGSSDLSHCVYLCWGHHLLLGHGMAPYGIDGQGGSADTRVELTEEDFPYWDPGR